MSFVYEFPLSFGGDDSSVSVSPSASALKLLLPRGRLWLLQTGSWLSETLFGASLEMDRAIQRMNDLVNEADPRTATETLEDWEQMLGFPNAQVPVIAGTDAERRVAITQAMVAQGGQNSEYYVTLGLACGYIVTVTDGNSSTVLRAGFRAGAYCRDTAWAFWWSVRAHPTGGPALTHAQFEAVIRKAAPAHTVVSFLYI